MTKEAPLQTCEESPESKEPHPSDTTRKTHRQTSQWVSEPLSVAAAEETAAVVAAEATTPVAAVAVAVAVAITPPAVAVAAEVAAVLQILMAADHSPAKEA